MMIIIIIISRISMIRGHSNILIAAAALAAAAAGYLAMSTIEWRPAGRPAHARANMIFVCARALFDE